MKLCKVDGCNEKHWAKGYCSRHFTQISNFGKILTRTRNDPNNFIIENGVGKIECFDIKMCL